MPINPMTPQILDQPRDIGRYQIFDRRSNEHQAKLYVETVRWIVDNYTDIGDTILDPMSGVGTIHLAATMGRHTIALEIVDKFVEIQHLNIASLNTNVGITATTTVLEGDCRRFLPLPKPELNLPQPNIIIFSPPYGDLWKVAAKSDFLERKHINIGYAEQDANVGQISNYPMYLNAMKEIYGLCYQSLPVGGRLITVVKDYIKAGQRILCSKDNVIRAMSVGFRMEVWHKRQCDFKLFQIQAKEKRIAKGTDRLELNIMFEDILVMVKD